MQNSLKNHVGQIVYSIAIAISIFALYLVAIQNNGSLWPFDKQDPYGALMRVAYDTIPLSFFALLLYIPSPFTLWKLIRRTSQNSGVIERAGYIFCLLSQLFACAMLLILGAGVIFLMLLAVAFSNG